MKHGFETLTGAIVVCGAAAFMYFAYNSGTFTSVSDAESYNVSATFGDIGSLGAGADVRVSGVKIGYVESLGLDTESYRAKVMLRVDNAYNIPDDSSAAIVGDGLLGGKYIQIVAGGSDDGVAAGGNISYTQDAVSLESLIGKFAFGGGDEEEKKSESSDEDDPFKAGESPFK